MPTITPETGLIQVWKAGATSPEPQTCETPGWPNVTTCGEKMYVNTHFDTKAEAWERVRSSCEAGLSMAARRVEDAERALSNARTEAAEAAKRWAAYREARDEEVTL